MRIDFIKIYVYGITNKPVFIKFYFLLVCFKIIDIDMLCVYLILNLDRSINTMCNVETNFAGESSNANLIDEEEEINKVVLF